MPRAGGTTGDHRQSIGRPRMIALARWAALLGYFGLLGLLLAWTVAVPGSYPVALVLLVKVAPLLLPLRGLLHGRIYTHAWSSFLALYYFVLAVDDIAAGRGLLGWLELALCLLWFTGCIFYTRLRARQLRALAAKPD